MLRASAFCRPREEASGSVRLDLDHNAPLTNSCLVSLQFLQQHRLIQGRYVWIECENKKVRVKLVLDVSKDEEEQNSNDESAPPIIRVSALVAANLGLLSAKRHLSKGHLPVGSLRLCMEESILQADQVLLRYYARPVTDDAVRTKPTLEHENSSSQDDGSTNHRELWPLPEKGAILQTNTIICLENENQQRVFYQIIRINSTTSDALYQCSHSTTVSLQAPSFSPCPLLPRLVSSSPTPPHPNLQALTDYLRGSSSAVRATECIFHIVGDDEHHHIHTLLPSVSSELGRRYITLPRGWASFAFQKYKSIGNGGLTDKLKGLQAALDMAKQHIPSLLHIYFDATEFSLHDQEQFQDEQIRIWSLLIQELAGCNYNLLDESLVSPLIIVVSTRTSLPPGPFAESFVFDSFDAVTPDSAYIRYLWSNVLDLEMTKDLLDILQGRPACEIEALKDKFVLARENSTRDTDPTALLQELAQHLDKQRRTGLARIPQVQWSDVGGLQTVRREIMDTIDLPLKYPHLFPEKRSGILLYGPPGTGKTLVAKAVATECNLPFLSIKGPELLGSYVGESEENVRSVFAQARQLAQENQPPACVLFFDELDSLAPRRGDQASGGGSVMDRVVATLFAELDKKPSNCSVYCMGATNRPDLLDSALLRPGRLDRLVYLGMPSSEDQVMILAAQMRKLRLTGDAVELARQVVVHIPPNVTGADLSTVASQALLSATERLCEQADRELEEQRARKKCGGLTMDDLLESWDTDKRTPRVTLDDLLIAAREVVPSVSRAELAGYERLRLQFQSALPDSTTEKA